MPTIGQIMRAEHVEVAPQDTLGEVAERMTALDVGAVAVKDFGRLIGILTERDLLRAMAARVHSSDARVREWMTEDPVTVSPETDATSAAETMIAHGFRHLPVVDADGAVVGLISLRRVVAVTPVASAT